MRKLVAYAAMGLLAAAAHPAWALVGLEGVSYDGSVEFSGVSANNETDFDKGHNDGRGEVNSRIRVGVNAAVSENAKGRVEFVRDNAKFGQNLDGAQGQPNTIDSEIRHINIQNAYLEFGKTDGLRAVLGRQYAGNEGDLVWRIGPKYTDALQTQAIDGLLLQSRNWAWVNADLFLGKYVDDDPVGGTDTNDFTGDVNLNSFDLTFPTIIPGGKINLGYMWGTAQRTGAVVSDNRSLDIYRVGLRGGVAQNMLTYRAEFLMNGGQANESSTLAQKVDYSGNAIDLGLGFNAPENNIGGFGVEANWLMASGDDNVTDNKDKSFHDFTALGAPSSDRYFGEILGRSAALTNAVGAGNPIGNGLDSGAQGQGKEIVHLGAKWVPVFFDKKSWVRLDWVNMQTNKHGDTALTTADKIGDEIDGAIGYKPADNLWVEGGYALLSPDKGLTTVAPGAKSDNVTKLFARLTLGWGGEAKE